MKECKFRHVLPAVSAFLLLSCLVHSVRALNLRSDDPALRVQSNVRTECSKTCQSQFCDVPAFMRYGKYCGIMYTGCPGEAPCDSLDACCQRHDACVEGKKNLIDTECSAAVLECMMRVRESGVKEFKGSNCVLTEVADQMISVMTAALVFGDVIGHHH